MNTIDFSTYTFRASSLPILMVNSRSKKELLSETAKAKLREIWIKEIFGRERFDVTSKYTEKGTMCEPDSMELVKKVTKKTYFKNPERFFNEFINGEPDIVINPGEKNAQVKDIKTSWDIWTFNKVDEAYALKTYYYQLLGYMWLTGAQKAELLFCLVNTPEPILMEELRKLSYSIPEIGTSDAIDAQYRVNYIFDDIEPKLRLKRFQIEYNQDDVDILQERLLAAREYLKGLSL